jgi:hypothetical protein
MYDAAKLTDNKAVNLTIQTYGYKMTIVLLGRYGHMVRFLFRLAH